MLIVADWELGRRMGQLLDGERHYAVTLAHARDLASRWQPTVILLDVLIGGTGNRAVEEIPTLNALAPWTAVIVVSRSPSRAEKREMVALGAYDCVDRDSATFDLQLAAAVRVAQAAAPRRRYQQARSLH